jgi:hypothetical protein
MFSFLCRHTSVEIIRAHPKSRLGIKLGHLTAWEDEYGVLNMVRCRKCLKVLPGMVHGPVYGTGRRRD